MGLVQARKLGWTGGRACGREMRRAGWLLSRERFAIDDGAVAGHGLSARQRLADGCRVRSGGHEGGLEERANCTPRLDIGEAGPRGLPALWGLRPPLDGPPLSRSGWPDRRAVVSSSLVKAAIHGRDPNWGRVVGAAGNARLADPAVLVAAGLTSDEAEARGGRAADVVPERLRVAIAGRLVFDGTAGGPLDFDRAATRSAMDAPECLIRLDLGLGDGAGEAFGCDLTEAYVRENAEYTT